MSGTGPDSGATQRVDLAREPEFAVGAVHARPALREVVIDGEHQTLQPRVMQVFVTLARRRGEVVSRDQLVSSCWSGLTVSEDAISRCIAQLRRLQELCGCQSFTIDTIPRVGYRLTVKPEQTGENVERPAALPLDKPAITIAVLPFDNMSSDPEQEYFSDGITEDIITDLSRISAIAVVARNTVFTFKGKAAEALQVAKQTNSTHILEGSVRKVGNRVRITAQLIDGLTGNHLWAERYDRDLADIFNLQDEISRAVVGALKLQLLPEEETAIGRRGTTNAEAYRLILMARQYGAKDSPRYIRVVQRLCENAIQLDPEYANAWARLARARCSARSYGIEAGDVGEALDRALQIDPNLADAHAVRATTLEDDKRHDEADAEIALALKLDPDSYEVLRAAALLLTCRHKYEEAIVNYEKAAAILDTDFAILSMAAQCYEELGDLEGARSAAHRALRRIEQEIARDPANSSALAHGASLLAFLGEVERAKEWAAHAALVDPDDLSARYNLACMMVRIGEIDSALDCLAVYFQGSRHTDMIAWAKSDSDLDAIREHKRFKALIAEAETRLAVKPPRKRT